MLVLGKSGVTRDGMDRSNGLLDALQAIDDDSAPDNELMDDVSERMMFHRIIAC